MRTLNPSDARSIFAPDGGATTSVPADPLEFFRRHIRPKTGGHHITWSFERHEYLQGIIADPALNICVRKAAQVAMSTLSVGLALHESAAFGYHVGYYLPTDRFIRNFVQARFDPLIDADESLATLVVDGDPQAYVSDAARKRQKRADHRELKIIGRGQLWFQGCADMSDVISIDLDRTILDEVDELDQDLSAFIDDRTLHSAYGRRIALSQPSIPGHGIDAEFEASDQKHWLLRCPRCRTWTCLEESFPKCLVYHQAGDEWRIVCIRCGARLPYATHESPESAEWVAKHPDREVSGYHVSQLYGPQMTPRRIATQWQKAQRSRQQLQRFTISVRGFPFAGDRQPISDEAYSAACNGDVKLQRRPLDGATATWAGIDVGDVSYLAVGCDVPGQELQVVWFEEIEDDWTLIERRLRELGVRFFVIDARPEKSRAKALIRQFPNQGAMAMFSDTLEHPQYDGIEDEDIEPVRYCKVPRTDALDDLCDDLKGGDLRLPAETSDVAQTVKRHLKNLIKDLDPVSLKYRYRRNIENHYGLALCYMRLARIMALALGLGPPADFALSDITIARDKGVPVW